MVGSFVIYHKSWHMIPLSNTMGFNLATRLCKAFNKSYETNDYVVMEATDLFIRTIKRI